MADGGLGMNAGRLAQVIVREMFDMDVREWYVWKSSNRWRRSV